MRIGILTYHCPPNFGAQLQAISTVGYLRRMGHEPIVLNWYPKDLESMYSRRVGIEQILCHEEFTQQVFPLSQKCQSEEELIAEINRLRLEAILVGSDALFKYFPLKRRRHFVFRRLKYIYHYQPLSCECLEGNPFFGAFVSKIQRRIPASAYAVSSQNCPYFLMDRTEKATMKKALAHYELISVRDAWTQKMVQHITKRCDVPIFPDPVFSFQQNCYLSIPTKEEILAKYGLKEDYVLFSFSAKHYKAEYVKAIANQIAHSGMQPVALPMPERLFAADIQKQITLPLSPLEWYSLIKYAQGYVGERMHPIVVCLHNAVPFFCFDEYGTTEKRGLFNKKEVYIPSSSKTFQIVSAAGLQDNLYSAKAHEPLPSPLHIADKLSLFDKNRCLAFALQKAKEYDEGMQRTIQSLTLHQ